MKDSLKEAFTRIDSLQIQLDSLKNVTHKYNPGLMEDRLQQASETVNYLGTMATGWGTVYATISLIVVGITIGLPIWARKNAKKSLKQFDKKFKQKIIELENANKIEIERLNTAFFQQINTLSENNSIEIQAINNSFSDRANELENIGKNISIFQTGLVFLFKGIIDLQSDRKSHAIYHISFCLDLYIIGNINLDIDPTLKHLYETLTHVDSKTYLEEADILLLEHRNCSLNEILEKLRNRSDFINYQKNFENVLNELSRIHQS